MFKTIITLSVGIALLVSCGSKGVPGLMPELNSADSIAVVYYKTPGNPRFFTFSKSSDTTQMKLIAANANQAAKKRKKDCLTDGKIFFYRGSEEAYPLYFSLAEDCTYFYFIRTGEKYYVPLSKESRRVLEDWKKGAKEPAPEQ